MSNNNNNNDFEYPTFTVSSKTPLQKVSVLTTSRNPWIVDKWYQKVAYVLGWINTVTIMIYLVIIVIALIAAISTGNY